MWRETAEYLQGTQKESIGKDEESHPKLCHDMIYLVSLGHRRTCTNPEKQYQEENECLLDQCKRRNEKMLKEMKTDQ
jgi:hypothetical protein